MQHLRNLSAVALVIPLTACAPSGAPQESTPFISAAKEPAVIVPNMCEGRDGIALANQSGIAPTANARAAAAIQCDAYDIATHISSLKLPSEKTRELHERLMQIVPRALEEIADAPIKEARLPLSDSHAHAFELAAEAERNGGSGKIHAWPTNPWRPLHPLAREAEHSFELSSTMMRGERRSLALNIRTTSASSHSVRLQVHLPGFAPDALRVYRVNWTGNDLSTWVAAELELLGDASALRSAALSPGITQQIWIEVNPTRSSTPGTFLGNVVVSSDSDSLELPLDVHVLNAVFPERLSMHFGGWDYTEGPIDSRYAITDKNRSKVVEYLRSRHVDVPWALRRTLHWENLDDTGQTLGALDTDSLESWLANWPDASRYRVHLGVRDNIAGVSESDSLFPTVVAAWARAWAEQIRRLGKSPEQFELLIVDEPATEEKALRTELWSRAIRRSGVGFRIWTDPLWSDPFATPPNLIEAADVVSINLGFAESSGELYWEWMRHLSAQGKTVEIYASDGPARRLDPYAYYRLATWRAFFAGASSVSFWSFADQNRTPAINEFATEDAEDYNYSPLFVTPDDVRPGKHMEAAAEGLQDVQYLAMLRDIAHTHRNHSVRERARVLLQRAEHFLSTAPQSSGARWQAQRESSEADQQIVEIGRFVDSLR